MNKYEVSIKNKILILFENNKKLILEKWISKFMENEKSIVQINKLLNIFKCVLVSYICCLKSENENISLKCIKETVETMEVNDISYDNFITSIPYFQESYICVLLKKLKYEDLEKCINLSNRVYNKILIAIQNEYLNINDSTLTAMLKLSELRDDVTGHHLERAKEYAVLLSKELNLDDKFVKHMSKASLLHDIGKVAVRDEILLKPGKLTEDEYKEIKKHTIVGAKTISKVISVNEYTKEYLYMAIDIALGHHEKYDGSGYPNGINGIKIPLCARIFALVDAYDVITSERPYKKPFSHEEAVRRIVLDSGKHFDPYIVNAFMRIHNKFEAINNKYKQDNEKLIICH